MMESIQEFWERLTHGMMRRILPLSARTPWWAEPLESDLWWLWRQRW